MLSHLSRFRRNWGCPDSDAAGEAGYAAVDALVALTILSTTLILAIDAGAAARKAALTANETRRAEALLRYLVDSAPSAVGAQQGHAGSFAWSLKVQRTGGAAVGNVGLCSRDAAVRSDISGRAFNLATSDLCPMERGA